MSEQNKTALRPQTSGSYWASLTEDELLRTSFTTDNPEGLPDLVEAVPPNTGQMPFVEYWYDFRGTKRDRIRCVHCRYHNHLAGYVVRTAEGQRFLVGHDCGDKLYLYGADFEALRKDYDDAKAHALNLRRWRNLQSALPTFLEWLSELQKCAAVRAFRDTKKAFREELPRLFGALSVTLSRDRGVLSIEERQRDFEAENRAQDRYDRAVKDWNDLTTTERKYRRRYGGDKGPTAPQFPIYKLVPRAVMTIRAERFFSDKRLPHAELGDVLKAFEELAADVAAATLRHAADETQQDTDNRESRYRFGAICEGVFSRMNVGLDQIKATVDDVGEVGVFFRLDNLSMVALWATAHPKIKEQYVVRARGIAAENPPRGPVALPADFAQPSLDGLQRFVKAVNAVDRIAE